MGHGACRTPSQGILNPNINLNPNSDPNPDPDPNHKTNFNSNPNPSPDLNPNLGYVPTLDILEAQGGTSVEEQELYTRNKSLALQALKAIFM